MKTRIAVLTLLVLSLSGCSTVRLLREPGTLPVTGRAERTRSSRALDYSVAIRIAATPEVVWQVLTEAPQYTRWNSTVVSLGGTIAEGSRLKLVSRVAPKRAFNLKVSTFDAPHRMVWEDGNSMFLGVRTFTLEASADSTTFAMSETFSGGMLRMIAGRLPDFTHDFEAFASDVKREAESRSAAPAY
ncbi:MAG: SRPBCC domain-containing protein [Candidatus Eisenbacteria bacterium]|uniref:SRPBCC domain-containing protein n=1 Tax=Eiseniibacteriota bacterium TaxID=2212470 RepID=A0A849SFV5_UNCEI|nr:SRPBCC domain-containing protein [Candidatus Eisenbacteria bacterium]